jgi:4-amino-4-deoxy-L-arabinose transferase-like glycosyltransferase
MSVPAFIREHRVAIAIFALALVVRLVYLGFSIEAWGGDVRGAVEGSDYYTTLSDNILAGNGFSIDENPPYELNSFRTPIMPYYLAATRVLFGDYGGAILFQIVLASLLPLLAMRLARFITTTAWIPITVGIFMALEPYTILFSTIFYSETVFILLFFVSLIYFFMYLENHRLLHLLFSGAFMGFAMLTKPTVEFLPLFLGVLLLWLWRSQWRRELLRVALFGGVCLLIISPWLYRNYLVAGTPGLSPQAGTNLYTVLLPSVYAVKNGTSYGVEFEKLINSGVAGPNNATVSQSAQYTKIAIPLLLQNPVPLALVSGNTTLNFFIHDGMYDVLRHLKIRPERGLGGPALFVALKNPAELPGMIGRFIGTPFVSVLVGRIFWTMLTVLFMIGAIRYLWREMKPAGLAALVVIIYFLLTTLIIGLAVNARYRLPVNIFIVTIALYGAVPIVDKIRSRYGT